jgi:REP element-mobilizing transposase RayT
MTSREEAKETCADSCRFPTARCDGYHSFQYQNHETVLAGALIRRPITRGRIREAAEECSPRQAVDAVVETASQPPEGGVRNVSHTSGNILLHVIFSTHGRRPLIKPNFRDDLFAYLRGIVREMNATALIIDGIADHVHMLVRIRPAHSPAEVARVVKANSSRWVRKKWDANFARQTGYGVFSVSESNVGAVTKYIAGQEEHHRKYSFQEEYVALLKKNNVAYDERYIWD